MDNLESLSVALGCEADSSQEKIASLHSEANNKVYTYLMAESEELQNLDHWRKEIFHHPDGDKYFDQQRKNADKPKKGTPMFFYTLMKTIGRELAESTIAFQTDLPPADIRILDMCMAPGGFLETALVKLPKSTATAFTLPVTSGGHEVLLPSYIKRRVKEIHVDITMLAKDMGIDSIPDDHPEANDFLPQNFHPDLQFDLVICDGQVLRTHERLSYRERLEAMRLTTAQLALGLEHLRPGGTMIVLLHGLDSYKTVRLLWDFSRFSFVQVHKPQSKAAHQKKSSFYMVASYVNSSDPAALECIARWKARWKEATFGSHEHFLAIYENELKDLDDILETFGPQLVRFGKDVWNVQAKALEVLVANLDYKAKKQAEK